MAPLCMVTGMHAGDLMHAGRKRKESFLSSFSSPFMNRKNFGYYNKKSPNRSHLDPGISLLIHSTRSAFPIHGCNQWL
jgi:hypothetical protein